MSFERTLIPANPADIGRYPKGKMQRLTRSAKCPKLAAHTCVGDAGAPKGYCRR